MLNLIKKDYLFTKKIILYTVIYCFAMPFVLLFDSDGKTYFADMLIPLAMVTGPLAQIMSKEDTKSGVIFQKTLPYTSFEKVGARFIFVISLLLLGNIFLGVMKQFVFKTQNFGDAIIESIPVFIGFEIYYAIYMLIYYWKGYFASQFCIYFLIILIVFSKRLMNEQVIELMVTIMNNKVSACVAIMGILAICISFVVFLNRIGS